MFGNLAFKLRRIIALAKQKNNIVLCHSKMTDTENIKHCAIIKFCKKKNFGMTQTRSLVFKWHKGFSEGRDDVTDESGRV